MPLEMKDLELNAPQEVIQQGQPENVKDLSARWPFKDELALEETYHHSAAKPSRPRQKGAQASQEQNIVAQYVSINPAVKWGPAYKPSLLLDLNTGILCFQISINLMIKLIPAISCVSCETATSAATEGKPHFSPIDFSISLRINLLAFTHFRSVKLSPQVRRSIQKRYFLLIVSPCFTVLSQGLLPFKRINRKYVHVLEELVGELIVCQPIFIGSFFFLKKLQ